MDGERSLNDRKGNDGLSRSNDQISEHSDNNDNKSNIDDSIINIDDSRISSTSLVKELIAQEEYRKSITMPNLGFINERKHLIHEEFTIRKKETEKLEVPFKSRLFHSIRTESSHEIFNQVQPPVLQSYGEFVEARRDLESTRYGNYSLLHPRTSGPDITGPTAEEFPRKDSTLENQIDLKTIEEVRKMSDKHEVSIDKNKWALVKPRSALEESLFKHKRVTLATAEDEGKYQRYKSRIVKEEKSGKSNEENDIPDSSFHRYNRLGLKK